ncbi:ATP-binding cassette domain-containing protein [Plantibacter flavus]|uniref:ATP-binding cassette domain-containing protein n=1 Tax=Plantibacter flavus TaxID=150123 RepID=UPI003F164137
MPVTLSGLGHRFDDGPWLFENLSTILVPGRSYSLTGPSGSGKSTFLALLAGWITPAAGVVLVPTGLRTTWVFQNPHGSPRRSVQDHVALPYLAHGYSPHEADRLAVAMLDRVGLSARSTRPFRELSGGEAQRLMLARGMATAPDLLLVDEPTSQLDRATAATVNQAIPAIAAEETIIVVATHDPATRAACSDHITLGHPVGTPSLEIS